MIELPIESGVALMRLSTNATGCGVTEFYAVMVEGQVIPGQRFETYNKAFRYLEKRMAMLERRRARETYVA